MHPSECEFNVAATLTAARFHDAHEAINIDYEAISSRQSLMIFFICRSSLILSSSA